MHISLSPSCVNMRYFFYDCVSIFSWKLLPLFISLSLSFFSRWKLGLVSAFFHFGRIHLATEQQSRIDAKWRKRRGYNNAQSGAAVCSRYCYPPPLLFPLWMSFLYCRRRPLKYYNKERTVITTKSTEFANLAWEISSSSFRGKLHAWCKARLANPEPGIRLQWGLMQVLLSWASEAGGGRKQQKREATTTSDSP